MLEVTQRLGGTNYVLWGGREGYDTLLNTDLKREGDQLARFLHLVAEHKHRIGFEGTLLIEPKPMEPTKHQYDYDSATDPRLPRPERARGRVPPQHRGQPRDARRPLLPPRGRLRRRERDPRQHRRQPRRPAERLGHRPVPELRRGPRAAALRDPARAAASRPAASTSTPSSAARARTGPTCSTPTSAASTRSPGRCSSPRSCSSAGRCREPLEERYAGWNGALGTAILDGRETLASLEAKVASGEIDPKPVSGRQEELENARQPGHLDGRRAGPRRDRRGR